MFYFWLILGIIMVLIGIAGVLVPFLPGIPLAFLGAFVLAYITNFEVISPVTLIILAAIALLSLAVDYFSGIIGARWGKASIWGVFGALLGTIIGIITIGPLGIILGPVLGVLIFELVAKKNVRQATYAAGTTFATSIIGLATGAILAILFAVVLVIALIY